MFVRGKRSDTSHAMGRSKHGEGKEQAFQNGMESWVILEVPDLQKLEIQNGVPKIMKLNTRYL